MTHNDRSGYTCADSGLVVAAENSHIRAERSQVWFGMMRCQVPGLLRKGRDDR